MQNFTRRDFIKMAMRVGGAGGALGMLPPGLSPGLRNALAMPASNRHGTIQDVEHIVILMQENRSFDHYFGTLRGVRGYGDTRAVTMRNGKTVWHQPTGMATDPQTDARTNKGAEAGEVLPFRPPAPAMGQQFLEDLPHEWRTTHAAWNNGRYDQWVPSKGTTTMAYMTRDDIPYHYALADAFTICDAYHCSALAETDPNRFYMWTGWTGNDGNGGGPVVDNSQTGYSWQTYPEILDAAGVSWKIYQDIGNGLDKAGNWGWSTDPYIGNYGDSSLLFFDQYRHAQPGSSLYQKARTGTNAAAGDGYFDHLKRDVAANTLPQVSWIVAPEAFSEHPNWPANYGAWYVDQALQVLTSDADLWSKTVLLINYDENDGFFDHIVPPTPPIDPSHGASNADITNERYAGSTSYAAGPYGLGPRVPLIAVSPWSKGGYVCSQVFDHTSVIRFIEKRFGQNGNLHCPAITAWREAVSGDLTSVFNFKSPNASPTTLPDTSVYTPTDKRRHADYIPVPPRIQAVPKQEPGLRPARAVPYDMRMQVVETASSTALRLRFENNGDTGVVFQVYTAGSFDAPSSYTVAKRTDMCAALPLGADGAYDFTVHAANGFLRRFAGTATPAARQDGIRRARPCVDETSERNSGRRGDGASNSQATTDGERGSGSDDNGHASSEGPQLCLVFRNEGDAACTFTIHNRYDSRRTMTKIVRGSNTETLHLALSATYGWYDLEISVNTDPTFSRRLGGHIETGQDSYSDPALGGEA